MDANRDATNSSNGTEAVRVVIWTQPFCPLCEQVKEHFADVGYEERAASELTSGADRDPEAMAQLAMQNMELPMIRVDGEYVSPRAVLAQARAA